VSTKKSLALSRPDGAQDKDGLFDTQRNELPAPTQCFEGVSLDPELTANAFHLTRSRTNVPSQLVDVDAGGPRSAVIHNAFFVPGKVPSLNDLLEARGARAPTLGSIILRRRPGKAKSLGARFDLYNDIKQDWKQRTIRALTLPFVSVQRCYFGYLVVEETHKRDPSNICSAAVKFIEDGLVDAGVIPNDGWDNVLGIRVHWVHRKGRDPGIYVIMSDAMLPEQRLLTEYEDYFIQHV
jgi:hypothetical protein